MSTPAELARGSLDPAADPAVWSQPSVGGIKTALVPTDDIHVPTALEEAKGYYDDTRAA
jgi:hypothetical protein